MKSTTAEYRAWYSMRKRCLNPNDGSYHNYGGRGIRVCAEWEDFSVFLNDMGQRPPGTSLGRIDNEKGYFKENCEWQTPSEQSNNRRGNVMVVYSGVSMTLTEASEVSGLSIYALRSRHQRGKELFTPILTRFECGKRAGAASGKARAVQFWKHTARKFVKAAKGGGK